MPRTKQEPLTKFYNEESQTLEIGIDEAGRGPLFGRVYTAAVILPKDDLFEYDTMKDSKKFSSSKKILEAAEHIKKHALAWSVTYNDETVVDKINIRQSVLSSMHNSIKNVIDMESNNENEYFLLVDGNDFKPYMRFNNDEFLQVKHICIEGGDNKYCAIAAASILAKTERDKYIEELCEEYPELKDKYSIHKNKGYGTKLHLDGIKEFGISKWHRKSYGICKDYC
jgi:ribonuclease HII|tara:strand:+ start:102 stop:779 length:678 start_codon:yes stop_codon:yes gene_type:complete